MFQNCAVDFGPNLDLTLLTEPTLLTIITYDIAEVGDSRALDKRGVVGSNPTVPTIRSGSVPDTLVTGLPGVEPIE